MICKECGAYNSDRARFCKVCGASLLAPVEEPEAAASETDETVSRTEAVAEEPEPDNGSGIVREKESATTRFTKKRSSSKYIDEDDDEDEEEPAAPAKRRKSSSVSSRVKVRSYSDEDEDDEEEENSARPKKGLFSGRASKRVDEDNDEEDYEDDEDDEEEVRPARAKKGVYVGRNSKRVQDDEDEDDEIDDEDDEEEDEKPSRPKKGLFSSRSSKRSVKKEEDEDEDDDEEDVKPSRSKKGLFARRSSKRDDDEDDDDDEEEEYDEEDDEEEEDVKPSRFKKQNAKASKKRLSKYDEDDDDDEEDEDDDEDDDDDEEDDVKTYSSKKRSSSSRAAAKRRRYDEDDDEEEDDDDYEEYESTPPRSKKHSSGGKSNLLVILLAAIAIILVIMIAIVVLCNTKAEYQAKLPSFLQFSSCAGDVEPQDPEEPAESDLIDEPDADNGETEPEITPEPVQEYAVEEVDYTAASMEETVNADNVECIKVKFYLLPGETMTAVLPNQDDMVYKNENENYLDIALEIPKDCYKPNKPLDSAEYVVTPIITVTAADGTVSSRDVGSFTMTFPVAQLEIISPAEIPEEGVMCPKGNVLHFEGKTNDHTVTVMANDQKLQVYAEGVIKGDYVLAGDEPEDVVIVVSGDNLVTTSRTITVLPYVFIPETMDLAVEGTAKDHKAATKTGKITLTGKVSPGSEVTASCDYEDVKCGSVLVNADGSFSLEVTFGTNTYGMFGIKLHATQEGYDDGELTTYVYRMYDDRKAFVNGYQKSKSYKEMPAKITFDKMIEDPNAYGGYRIGGKIEAVTEQDGFEIVQFSAQTSKKDYKTVYILNMSSAWDPSKNVGTPYKVYCTLNGLYSDGESLFLIGWFAMK